MRKTPLWKIPTTPHLCRCLGPMDPLRSEERNMSVSKRAGRDPPTVSPRALQNWSRVLQDAGKHFTASLANSMKERYHVSPRQPNAEDEGKPPVKPPKGRTQVSANHNGTVRVTIKPKARTFSAAVPLVP